VIVAWQAAAPPPLQERLDRVKADLNPRLVQVRFFLARLYLDLGRAVRAREGLVQTPAMPNSWRCSARLSDS
jgi:hypothetical protein